jgi:hypothetical protein
MAWMPHRAIDQPNAKGERPNHEQTLPGSSLRTFFDQLAALVKIPEDVLQELDYGIDR